MHVLVGYLRTAEGRAALDAAVAETRLRNGRLTVVHSMKGGRRDEAQEAVTYRDEFAALEQRLAGEGIPYQVRELVRGNSPSEDLLDFAAEQGADLIVIGIRRRSPVGKLVLGSNAQDIMLRAECPVLAVKAAPGA